MSKTIRSRPANPWWQRWLRRWRAWRGAGLAKTHQVDLIELEGRRQKRVIFNTAETARAVTAALKQAAVIQRFPALIFSRDCEVRVEFIPGPLARPGRDDDRLRDFFLDLYRLPTDRVDLARSGLLSQLESDLAHLVDQTLIEATLSRRLQQQADQIAPPSLWLGHDYVDPVAKNFVIQSDRAIAIDIEALLAGQPLGTGLAKARLRWPGLEIEPLMVRLEAVGGPELRGQYPLVELCFLAGYFRQKLIQRKRRHLKPEALVAWLQRT